MRRRILAGLAALSLLLTMVIAGPPPTASAELFQPRQQWLREASNGLFLHWGMWTAPGHTDCAEWERAVTDGGWNANYWIDEAIKLHAQYVVLASFHSRLGYARAWPSAIPGTCSTKRDFLGELIAAGKAKGVKTILYMTDDPQWYWEHLRPEKPTDPNDPLDTTKPSWMNSAAYSAYKGREVNLQLRPGFGEFSYDNFVEVMGRYRDLAGFWIDNDNQFWEQNHLYERIRAERPDMTLSNNNEDTPIMDMVSHEQKVGMTPAYDYPQAVWTPLPRLTEGEWKLPTKGNWWFDGTDGPIDYPVTMGRIISNAGSSIRSLMAETAQINGKFPPLQEEFNNFAASYLDPIWESIHGVEGAGYLYGGMVPGFWNDGAHGVVTISRSNPDLEYVHVLTKPVGKTSITLRDNGYRVSRVRDLRTGEVKRFTQAGGSLTIEGIASWDTYDTVFTVETAGRVGVLGSLGSISATASSSLDGFPASNLTDGDYLSYWDSNAALPVSLTVDLGRAQQPAFLAVNQREWSPTYNRNTFGRPEDSARIKDYRLEASADGTAWTPVRSGVMSSTRGVGFIDFTLAEPARFLRLNVDSTWAEANAPNYFHKLRIDELWVGTGYATPARPGFTYEAEQGLVTGTAHQVACPACSGGRKVEGLGGGVFNRDFLVVFSLFGGEHVLTVVGAAEGTRSVAVDVNFRPAGRAAVTGWSSSAPLVGRSLMVRLRPGFNIVTLSNVDAPAPDIDKIVVAPA